jgi:flagellar biosynthesis protein FliQ
MTPETVSSLVQSALLSSLLVAAPMLLACLVIGLVVGLFQALTQIQESTISFVPKLIGTGLALAAASGFMGATLGKLMLAAVRMVIAP